MDEIQKDVVLDEKGNILDEGQDQGQEQLQGEDAPLRQQQEESDQHQDEQAQEGETEEEAEERRNRNRARRAENKNRRKDYIDSLKREIAARDEVLQQQAQRLDALERRTHNADLSVVDAELRKSLDAYNYYKGQHAEAVTRADGVIAAEAQERMFASLQRAQQLDAIKKAAARQPNQPQPLDPRLKKQAEDWYERNDWYDPTGQDPDSQVALTIDKQMAKEGWNPTTSQYWEELDSRLKKYLPHRYNSRHNKAGVGGDSRNRAPVAGSGREGAMSNTSGGYRLSAERVQALKDAGLWADPKQRADAIKRFQQYDKEHQNG